MKKYHQKHYLSCCLKLIHLKEKEFHLKAIKADPKNPLFKLNYITSLICLGDIYNLKKAWSKYQQDIASIEIRAFNDTTYRENSTSVYSLIKGFVKIIKESLNVIENNDS